MSIRNLLFIVVGALSLLLVLVSGWSALEALRQRGTAGRVIELNAVADLLMRGGRALIEERDEATVALQAPRPATARIQDSLRAYREKADAIMLALEALRGAKRAAAREDLIRSVETALSALRGLRERVDADLARELVTRDLDLPTAWAGAMSGLIGQVEALRLDASGAVHAEDAVTANYSTLKNFTWVISDYAGRERALLARQIEEEFPLSPRHLQLLSDYRGRIELAWGALAAAGATDGVDALVTAAADAVGKDFMGDFDRLRNDVLDAGIAANDYPISAPAWISASTGAIGTLYKLQDALTAANEAHAAAQSRSASLRMIALLAVLVGGLTACGISFWIVAGRVARPVKAMTEVMRRLADGEIDLAVPALARRDEMGQMAAAVQVFKQNAIDKMKLESEQAQRERKLQEDKLRATLVLADRLEKSVMEVADTVASASTEMEATAQAMSANASETSQQSMAVASATEEATKNVQTVASSAEELTSSIQEIGRQVTNSSRVARDAVAQAEVASGTVKGLAEGAQKIGNVVEMINDVAEQTNLLALNATIEAARAGDAGKGFAVVASEVKALANQTAKATQEIAEQINAMRGVTGETVQAIETVVGAIGKIDEVIANIASAVEEQNVSTREIARNVQQAARSTEEINTNITGVSRAAGETGDAAAQVLRLVAELARQSDNLRGSVVQVVKDLKSA